MNWTNALIILAFVALVYIVRRSGQISSTAALKHLKSGALVIDVRSRGEFSSGHLPNAINLPLDEIEIALPRRVQDKGHVLLLHCQSGMRSGVAKRRLKSMGYSRAFNLGSYARAARIAGGGRAPSDGV